MSLRSEIIRVLNEVLANSKKISELPAGTTPAGTELIEGVQGGESVKFTISQVSSGGSGVLSIVAGTNVTVDDTDPQNPIVSASGGGGSGTVESVTGDGVDNTDPDNPVLSFPVASEVTNTPAGNISATTVQAAINELDTEKAPLASPTFTGTVTFPAGTIPKVIQVAFSDTTSAITASAGKVAFRMPYAMTVTAVRASLKTAQASGSIFTVDINEGASSILSTKLTIDNTEKTSTTAATPAVISDTALADDAEITIDVDQVGDGTAIGGVVSIIGY